MNLFASVRENCISLRAFTPSIASRRFREAVARSLADSHTFFLPMFPPQPTRIWRENDASAPPHSWGSSRSPASSAVRFNWSSTMKIRPGRIFMGLPIALPFTFPSPSLHVPARIPSLFPVPPPRFRPPSRFRSLDPGKRSGFATFVTSYIIPARRARSMMRSWTSL